MKKITVLVFLTFSLIACKEQNKEVEVVDNSQINSEEITTTSYPEDIDKVFTAHGGISTWNKMNNLCYEMDGRGGKETHTISLKDRKVKIENKKWSIGHDGNNVWLLQNEKGAYKGNARFYHNLMFYFYAMPFVVGDEGITYTSIEETELDGSMYNGVKISYSAGVGDSPEDEYIIYYNQETNEMEWLGYTVTFRSGEKSDDWHFIKYDEWITKNGLKLPKKLTWYNVEDGKPTDERNDLVFDNIIVSETELQDSMFKKPLDAEVVEK
ncbi:DUF6503 family protein [Patiriisocius hiemis]|uniref:DUF6503 family protein n=1 Tax=Patiriisocius hiemis TaxID=3075604 RepID=A0ABU2Y923_9FLAO|nr:DUF6503 family protein [Constantimarinum sp. W242]MDT0554676.1 DUF6503 family protein [Constantimarinum sp. W242]